MLVGVRMYVCMYVVFGKCPCTGIHAFWYNPFLWINQIIIMLGKHAFLMPNGSWDIIIIIIIIIIIKLCSVQG